MKTLIGMRYFVLEQNKNSLTTRECFINCLNYANFLEQPLELWMFVPCKLVNGVWVVLSTELEEGMTFNEIDKVNKEYQQAKEKCLFEEFEVIEISKNFKIIKNKKLDCQVLASQYENHYYLCSEFQIIEDLVKYNLQLTPTAIKQIGL